MSIGGISAGGLFATWAFAGFSINPVVLSVLIVVFIVGVAIGVFAFFFGEKPLTTETADFLLSPSLERLDPNRSLQIGDGRMFRGLIALWVAVENNSGDAVFTAQVRGVQPVVRSEDGFESGPRDVDEVAWENTTNPECAIRWHKRTRLKLAMGSDSFKVFWFWTAHSATWTDQGGALGWNHYGVGWRLQPQSPRVEFELEVIDTTHRHSEVRRCFIDFDSEHRIKEFGFLSQAINSYR